MTGKKQFDIDAALDAAMVQFWRAGYADTSVDDLSAATGLNRSSIYSSLGDKDTLFVRCPQRYVTVRHRRPLAPFHEPTHLAARPDRYVTVTNWSGRAAVATEGGAVRISGDS